MKLIVKIKLLEQGHEQTFELPIESASLKARITLALQPDQLSLDMRQIDVHYTEHQEIELRLT